MSTLFLFPSELQRESIKKPFLSCGLNEAIKASSGHPASNEKRCKSIAKTSGFFQNDDQKNQASYPLGFYYIMNNNVMVQFNCYQIMFILFEYGYSNKYFVIVDDWYCIS